MTIHFDENKQKEKIEQLKEKEEESLAQMIAKKYTLPYIDLSINPINIDSLRIIKEADSRESLVAPFNIINKKISIAIYSPNNPKTIETLENLKDRGYIIELFIASKQSLEKVWNRYKDLSYSMETQSGSIDIANEDIQTIIKDIKNISDIKTSIETIISQKKSYRISKILEIILAGAISINASDVHIEPEESSVRIRYRLDGVLNDILNIDTSTYNLLLSRIKLVSNLKLNTKEKAQDGRFSIKINDTEIEVRTSLLPEGYGESVVLRVLNPESISVPLEDLGIDEKLLNIIKKELKKPNGMILNTGPTGSGKTTTLYAFLKKIYTPEIKIITIENPIEYHLKGIVQTQTDEESGYTFLEGLRSALRQDPDVIMVGEIRDSETAEIAINSSLTGHLVFSTLHTNNVYGTFARLIDLGVNSKIITSAINLTMAQRLVRKICPYCKKQTTLESSKLEIINKIIDSIFDKNYIKDINLKDISYGVGCDKCNFTGFIGRTGVYEAILIDEKVEKTVEDNPSEREVLNASKEQGILTMQQDGIIKVLKGITTLDEVERVVGLDI